MHTCPLAQFRQTLSSHSLDAYLVLDRMDIRYLTGVRAEDAWLLVTRAGAYYLTDARYVEEMQGALKDIRVVACGKGLWQGALGICRRAKVRKIGFDERHVTLAQFRVMTKALPKTMRLQPFNAALEAMREIKGPGEIAQIEEALELNIAAFHFLRRVIRPGVTERAVRARLEAFVEARGACFSFEPIIASGPHSAFPHARVTDRAIRPRDVILIDMGVEVNGYKSDLTRIFVFDKIPPSVKRAYHALRQAQEAAIDSVQPGVFVATLDRLARKILKKNKLDVFCRHSLGHGVGLNIHEPPRISHKSAEMLRAGMVITIEPGIYMAGRYGLRIEDMVLVTPTGHRILSQGLINTEPFIIKTR